MHRLFVCCLLFAAILALMPASGAQDYPTESQIYGATLGLDWADFPVYLTPDLETTRSLEKLDVTLPIYLVWQSLDFGQPWQTGIQLVPGGPKRIDEVSGGPDIRLLCRPVQGDSGRGT